MQIVVLIYSVVEPTHYFLEWNRDKRITYINMSLKLFTLEMHVALLPLKQPSIGVYPFIKKSCTDSWVRIHVPSFYWNSFIDFLFFNIHSTLRLLLCHEIHKPLCNLFLCQAQPNFLPCVFPSAVSLWEGGGSCQGHHHRSRRPSGEQSFSSSTLSVNGIDAWTR